MGLLPKEASAKTVFNGFNGGHTLFYDIGILRQTLLSLMELKLEKETYFTRWIKIQRKT